MSAYLSELNKDVQQANELADKLRTLKESDQYLRMTPLDDRLKKLLTTIPIEQQRQGLRLSMLQQRLRGRYRGKCHPGELGRALKRLGFKRSRKWERGQPLPTVWRL